MRTRRQVLNLLLFSSFFQKAMLASTDSGGSVGRMRKRGMVMIGEHSPTWTRERRYTKKCMMMSSISSFSFLLSFLCATPHTNSLAHLHRKVIALKRRTGLAYPKKGTAEAPAERLSPTRTPIKTRPKETKSQEFAVATPQTRRSAMTRWVCHGVRL